MTDRFKRQTPCLTCGGQLEPRKRGRGFVMVDAMDTQAEVIRTEARDTPTRPSRMVPCDACGGQGVGGPHLDEHGREYRDPCKRCKGVGKRPVTVFDLQVDRERGDQETALERALERRDEQGDWAALEECLQVLPSRWRRLVKQAHVTRSQAVLNAEETAVLEAAMVALEFLMPDPVRVPPAILRADRDREARRALAHGRGAGKTQLAKRDGEIRKLARQGRPTQWIAQQYELSPQQTRAIIAGEAAA